MSAEATRPRDVYSIAGQLHAAGLTVIPVGAGEDGKKPLLDSWKDFQERQPTGAELYEWEQKLQPKCYAIVCGAKSGVIVVDADTQESRAALEAHGLEPHVLTPKGAHYYAKHPGHPVKPAVRVADGVDLRGDGSYAIVVGTRPDGGTYQPKVLPVPGMLRAVEDFPQEIQNAVKNGRKPKRSAKKAATEAIAEGERNARLTSIAGSLRRQGITPEAILATLLEVNRAQCNPPLPDDEVETIAQSVGSYEPGGPGGTTSGTRVSPDDGLPEIIISNRQLRAKTEDALQTMYGANDPPKVFTRAAKVVRTAQDEHGQPFIDTFTESAFRGRMARVANFSRITKDGDRVAMAPPLEVVRDALSLPAGDWRFPPLENIIEAPVIRADGSILSEPGYDSLTGLYHIPGKNLRLPTIAVTPSATDVQAATDILLDLLCDFPFDSDASRANAVAAIMTPILRRLISGQVPLALFDKPQPGTGATYLARIVNIIATGRDAALMPAPPSDEEWNKVITATVVKGQTIMIVDNVEERLQSAALATLLSAPGWKGRILGRTEEVVYPNCLMVIATGNNVHLGGDLPRRTVWVRLDTHTSRPWLRDWQHFRHPHIIEWTLENRGVLLGAILTIGRAWTSAGKPVPADVPVLGGYEKYSRTLGGILATMRIHGFLANLQAMYSEVDETTPAWMGFLEAWQHELGATNTYTSVEMVAQLDANDTLKTALPDWLADMSVKHYQRKLGNALAKIKEVVFPNGLMVVKAGEYRRSACWRIVSQSVSPVGQDPHDSGSNVSPCESATTPCDEKKHKNTYGRGVSDDSQGLTSGTKQCESEDSPDAVVDNDNSDRIDF